MSLRIDVLEDSTIEIMRPDGEQCSFFQFPTIDRAIIVIRYFIRKDLELARGNKFVSQAALDARKAFKLLQKRGPYNGTKR